MKISVHDILPAKPKRLSFHGSEPFMKEILRRLTADDPAPATPLPVADTLEAELTLTRDGRTVFVAGSAHATIHPPCDRCLRPVTIELSPSIDLSLLPRPDEDSTPEEMELAEEDLDDSTYSNEEIDVGAILNEQILLERPIRILCAEDCKGLCPSCGADLNEGGCSCPKQPASLAFAALKDFKV